MAGRELRERGRSKAFIFSLVLTLIFIAAIIVLPQLLGGGPAHHRVGVVGEGNDSVLAAVEEISRSLEEEEPDSFELLELAIR